MLVKDEGGSGRPATAKVVPAAAKVVAVPPSGKTPVKFELPSVDLERLRKEVQSLAPLIRETRVIKTKMNKKATLKKLSALVVKARLSRRKPKLSNFAMSLGNLTGVTDLGNFVKAATALGYPTTAIGVQGSLVPIGYGYQLALGVALTEKNFSYSPRGVCNGLSLNNPIWWYCAPAMQAGFDVLPGAGLQIGVFLVPPSGLAGGFWALELIAAGVTLDVVVDSSLQFQGAMLGAGVDVGVNVVYGNTEVGSIG
jgi:hypothetical protein